MTCSFGGGTTTTTSVRSTRSESTVFCHTNIVTMGTKDPYDTNDMAVKCHTTMNATATTVRSSQAMLHREGIHNRL